LAAIDGRQAEWRRGSSLHEAGLEEVGREMAGGQKPDSGGTEPKTAGSGQENKAKSDSADRQQEPDRIEMMEKSSKQLGPATVEPWFDRQLNQLYAEVVSEPLPKEMVELIEKLREKNPGK